MPMKLIVKMVLMAVVPLLYAGCTARGVVGADVQHYEISDSTSGDTVVRAGTVGGMWSVFEGRNGTPYGFDYELLDAFSKRLGCDIELWVARSESELVEWLRNGKVDMAAYNVQMSGDNRRSFIFAGNRAVTPKVLVQRRNRYHIISVVDLIGDTVAVIDNSKYLHRMRNMNDELGGGIALDLVPDTTAIEELMFSVSDGSVDFCIADEDIASVFASRVKNINYSVLLGQAAAKAWCFGSDNGDLARQFDAWYDSIARTRWYAALENKYRYDNPFFAGRYSLASQDSCVSAFDEVFRQEAELLAWDWRLLAAMAWNESHFNPVATSSQGAVGIMQLMPVTAAKMGLVDDEIYNPSLNIKAGVKYLVRLDRMFGSIDNREERVKFILAGYNAGPGRVFDAMAICKKYGFDPERWDGNVRDFMLKLSDKQFYTDSVCVHGFFRGKHTVRYVDDVFETYDRYCMKCK